MAGAGGSCVSRFVCNKYFFGFACDWHLAGRQNGAGAGGPGEVGELAGFAVGVEAVVEEAGGFEFGVAGGEAGGEAGAAVAAVGTEGVEDGGGVVDLFVLEMPPARNMRLAPGERRRRAETGASRRQHRCREIADRGASAQRHPAKIRSIAQ